MERSMSSKRSGAGAELVPLGLTERQALALALEESRRAALAVKHSMQDEEVVSSDDSSSNDESSAGGARGRGNSRVLQQRAGDNGKAAKRRQPRQRQGALFQANGKEPGTPAAPRKKARVEGADPRAGTSSENSKASRTTQQLLDLSGSLGGSLERSLTAADAAVAAATRGRGDSADSEHNSASGGSPDRPLEPAKVKEEVSSEGAGESGCADHQQQRQNGALDQDIANKLDARTIAEMARKRRERFGTCESAPSAGHKMGQKQLRRAASGAVSVKLQKMGSGAVPRLDLTARSRSGLAELVESDMFPDTLRRGPAASKTSTPVAPLSLNGVSAAEGTTTDSAQQPAVKSQDVAAAGVKLEASLVRTPSPVAGSPRSLQGSDTQDTDLAGDVNQKVKREAGDDAPQESGPREGNEQPAAPKQPKQRRKPGASPRQRQRLPALQVPRDSPDLAMQDHLVKTEGAPPQTPRKGRAPTGGTNRGARSVSRTPSRNLRWASSNLGSPAGGIGRRLRSAVVEEFKHNVDAMDPFAWQPQMPTRARASALLAACAVMAAQDCLPVCQAAQAHVAQPDGKLQAGRPSQEQPEQLQQQQEEEVAAAGIEAMDASAPPAAEEALLRAELPVGEPYSQAMAVEPAQASDALTSQPAAEGKAQDQASAMEVEIELSGELATPPGSPAVERRLEEFMTPAGQMLRGGSIEFPALAEGGSPAATPVLCTPALTPVAKWRLPLWKKLQPLSLELPSPVDEGEEQCQAAATRSAATQAVLPSPARAHVASAASLVCAAFKGRHGLEGHRLSSSCVADESDLCRMDGAGASPKPVSPFPSSRLGKALVAGYGSRSGGCGAANFGAACTDLRAPYVRARNSPAWRLSSMSRSGSAGSSCGLGINPHLARQRTQRNLQNTWEDLLARQALEVSTAEALATWAQVEQPGT